MNTAVEKRGTDVASTQDSKDHTGNKRAKSSHVDLNGECVDLNGEWLYFAQAESNPPNKYMNVDTSITSIGRNPPIIITGSSGSGKTTYAVRLLPNILREHDEQKGTFYVYMTGRIAFDACRLSNVSEVGGRILTEIQERLTCKFGANTNATQLKMVVIIDEVGTSKDKLYLDSRGKLDKIQASLFPVTNDVQLVLVGTGLDQIASSINSETESQKIRLAPWNQQLVESYIQGNAGFHWEELTALIFSTPLYKRLCSNPRSLCFLIKILCDAMKFYGIDTINTEFVVAQVTDQYIRANGLANLTSEQRRVVVMIVWKALSDAAWDDKTWPSLSVPGDLEKHFTNDEKQRMESCCYGLVDIHLESKGGEPRFVTGHHYSISVSSALSLVLISMTGNTPSLYRGSDDFEFAAAIHELQCLYCQYYPNKMPPAIKVLVSRSQFPGKLAGKARVPSVGKENILVNGPRSSFGDIISFGRISQAKYAENPANGALIDFDDELRKAGLLKEIQEEEEKYKRSRFTTNCLRQQWKNLSTEETGNKNEERSVVVPYQSGSAGTHRAGVTRHGSAVSKILLGCAKSEIDFQEKPMTAIQKQDFPITFAFITNARKFLLKGFEGFDIQRHHVDKDGALLEGNRGNEEFQKLIDQMLLQKVSVKFYFLEQDLDC